VPPGFGVQLLDATKRNMTAWLDGYIDLVDSLSALFDEDEAAEESADEGPELDASDGS
jgi:hypothetical protein